MLIFMFRGKPKETKKHIQNFSYRMQFSECDRKYRVRVYKGGRKKLDDTICNKTSDTSAPDIEPKSRIKHKVLMTKQIE